jgi:hypothetical protein
MISARGEARFASGPGARGEGLPREKSRGYVGSCRISDSARGIVRLRLSSGTTFRTKIVRLGLGKEADGPDHTPLSSPSGAIRVFRGYPVCGIKVELHPSLGRQKSGKLFI